jgi:hypothetical protein
VVVVADLDFIPTPTGLQFMRSDVFGRILAGPVGSGKTVTCINELLRRAIEQMPGRDGIRYTRFAVVRQTLQQLKHTVLKDCQDWLTRKVPIGQWKVSESTFYLNFNNIRSEWLFLPLEDDKDKARLLSSQLTGVWMSEAIEMDLNILAHVSARCGRFPNEALGVPTWHGMIADTNMPTELTPWHQFMENLPINWQKFIQPSGLAEDAENLDWLLQNERTILLPVGHPERLAQGRKYYENIVTTHGIDSDYVNRYVKAQYGNDPSGQAVFRATFQPQFHGVDRTTVVPGYPLLVAQDFGRNPWSLLCQPDHMGRLLCHEEVPAMNTGLEKHITHSLRPILWSNDYIGCKVAVVGDPAGIAKDSIGEESCFDVLKRHSLPAFPAPTNDIEPRIRAVEALLGQQRNGGPALIINKEKCPMLMRAMSGGYRFKKTPAGGLRTVPEKNDPEGFSHVADCLQYAALVVHGGLVDDIARRIRPPKKRAKDRITSAGWT